MAFNFIDWEKTRVIEGILVGKLKNVPPFRKYVFGFELPDGSQVHSWGFLTLVKEIMDVPFGTSVRVSYEGWQEFPETGRRAKIFKVDVTGLPDRAKKSRAVSPGG